MGSVTGVYYLSGVLTKLIPRSQADIVVDPIAVENVLVDNNLCVKNNVVYAEGAIIEVYDVMGRKIAFGVDNVVVDNINNSVIIVKTTYLNNLQFVTKLVNR